RELHGVAKCGATARDDADLVDGVGILAVGGDEGVADFVIGDPTFFFFAEAATFALGTGKDLLDGFFEVALLNFFALAASGQKSSFVDSVCEVGAGKAGSGLCDSAEVHFPGERFAANVNLQDRLASINVRRINDDLAIETARAQQRAVENIRTIRCGKDD